MTVINEGDTDDVHEVWLAPVFEDGERSIGSGDGAHSGSIAVEEIGQGDGGSIYRWRPAAEVIGWRVICQCYSRGEQWVSPRLWKRVPSEALENLDAAKIYAADSDVIDVDARPDVHDAVCAEWRREHMAEADAFAAVLSASRKVKESTAELSEAVAAARGVGLPWSKIGEAAQMSGQSAHERWSKRGETATAKSRTVPFSDLGPP
ncbi:hypothetical protein [Mycobacteroides franklinii]|uniref:Uncharacterized protein n=1 Tax=Mycobacteroides franklinii TaxID=948102 RepID=A0A4R5P5Q2_9MYCO|nr:hypothetical protein [Mycobacteroides franklinii]TDH17985.1 hypothetical protein EJ571_24975 [Mycobacteroides franklinii]